MKNKIILFCVALVCGFFIGRETIKPQLRTVVREVKVKDTVTHTNEQKRITKRPDGTVITEIERETDKHTQTQKQSKLDIAPAKPDWSIGVYCTNTEAIVSTIDRRIIGDLYVGVYLRARPPEVEAGLGLRYEF